MEIVSLKIERVYVPVKRLKTLDPAIVDDIAESMLEKGQITPLLVRADKDRYVLVEGLHRLEACKALGEEDVLAQIVQPDGIKTGDWQSRAISPDTFVWQQIPSGD